MLKMVRNFNDNQLEIVNGVHEYRLNSKDIFCGKIKLKLYMTKFKAIYMCVQNYFMLSNTIDKYVLE